MRNPESPLTRRIMESDLAGLCQRDEAMIRAAMETSTAGSEKRFTIIPDLDHMLWHIRKEDFATKYLFQRIPQAKGAIAGCPGSQIWALWTHRYYERPGAEISGNVLYILRLVVELDNSANGGMLSEESSLDETIYHEQISYLEAILQAAQAEAAEWKLNHVILWEPSLWVRDALLKLDFDHVIVERQEESIASGLWYDKLGTSGSPPIWVNNEHYAWC